jgi:4-hydroxy-tetrahydrodipicolinate synthase
LRWIDVLGSIVVSGHADARIGQRGLGALERLIELHAANGTAAIVSVGTTGESATLSVEEHGEVIRHSLAAVAGRMPVIAGTGGNATAEAIELTALARDLGRQCSSAGHALLQQADPGRALPALSHHRRSGRHPADPL